MEFNHSFSRSTSPTWTTSSSKFVCFFYPKYIHECFPSSLDPFIHSNVIDDQLRNKTYKVENEKLKAERYGRELVPKSDNQFVLFLSIVSSEIYRMQNLSKTKPQLLNQTN